ncbi:hypothetical protein [Streptomyces erythrochromogenes]|uniref:hypothetical protein n=1 Tax=Streptomyces erythrochromogenes TaxID=285574 RepID=UPI00340D579C
MQQLGEHHGTDTVAQYLGRLATNTSWQGVTGPALVGCPVDATLTSLTTPPGALAASRPRVSAGAARSRSTTTKAVASPGRQAPTESVEAELFLAGVQVAEWLCLLLNRSRGGVRCEGIVVVGEVSGARHRYLLAWRWRLKV